MKKYFGLTIGPIYDTISQVRRTRSVWAASYLFSWIMKEILTDISGKEDIEIVLPHFDREAKSENGAGLYGDRAYFLAGEDGRKTIRESIDRVIEKLTKETGGEKDFLSHYFNFYIEDCDEAGALALGEINKALDRAELFKTAPLHIEQNDLLQYLAELKNNGLLHQEAFGKGQPHRNFLSVAEIAAASLSRLNNDKFQNIVLKDLKAARKNKKSAFNEDFEFVEQLALEFGDDFQPHHKYFGVLYADGDNIGALLKQCQDNKDLQAFSKSLLDFGLKADKTIAAYGGKGIYLGGEDILAFIPMACRDENGRSQSFLELISRLDKDFKETVQAFAEQKNVHPLPTLSYGVMIAYYKHPLKEVMHKAHDLLEYVKKNIAGKNAINILFQKHSGQQNGCVILKELEEPYIKIREMVNTMVDKDEFLSGVMHRLYEDYVYELFSRSLADGFSVDAFVKNFMDLPKIISGSFEDKLIQLARSVHNSYKGGDKENLSDPKKVLFTTLRFTQFINTQKDE